jgi:HTH-type transcriptional regulator/antitoxin MqsA
MIMMEDISRDGEICPACDEGHLTSKMEMSQFTYRGITRELPFYYATCDVCGSELAGAAEMNANAAATRLFREEVLLMPQIEPKANAAEIK